MPVSGESNAASVVLDDLIGIGGFDTWSVELAGAPLPANVTESIILGQDGRPTLPLTPKRQLTPLRPRAAPAPITSLDSATPLTNQPLGFGPSRRLHNLDDIVELVTGGGRVTGGSSTPSTGPSAPAMRRWLERSCRDCLSGSSGLRPSNTCRT